MKQHRRALQEIELFQEHRIKVGGSIINYDKLYKEGHTPGNIMVCKEKI
jgi:hypothetical protein